MNPLYLKDPRTPDWGIGLVLRRRRSVPKATSGVEIVDQSSPSALLSAAAEIPLRRWGRAHHNVYVVELDPRAAEDPEFAAAPSGGVDRSGQTCSFHRT